MDEFLSGIAIGFFIGVGMTLGFAALLGAPRDH